MTAVFLLRHPLTDWNATHRYQGRLDPPVSDTGRRQAEITTKQFFDRPVSAVYSSPMRRAMYLGEQIATASHSLMSIDERLVEIAMGPWEGLRRDQIEQRFHDLYRCWYECPDEVRFPGGESVFDVQRRALSALRDIVMSHPAGNVVVVTHGVVVQVIVAHALGLSLRCIHRIRTANGGITTLCGVSLPLSLLSLNVTDALYGSAVSAAKAQNCTGSREGRQTQ